MDDLCLRAQTIIVMPSELVYTLDDDDDDSMIAVGCISLCCCPCVWLITCCGTRETDYAHMNLRIGISAVEWMVLIIWALVDSERTQFLFSIDYGLMVFVVSIICYFIHTQYLVLFPDFSLPFNIPIRSMHGYALMVN